MNCGQPVGAAAPSPPTPTPTEEVGATHTAALEMMEALQKFNARHGANLGMHAGINTGLVVSGGIGSQGRQQYSVMGDTVNLAARLEDASERGEILLGPDTYKMAAPFFEFATLEPIQVKGKAEPIQIYKLIGLKSQAGRARGLAGLQSRMVGRDDELAALLKSSRRVQAGQGQVAIIIGEPGLGKSRLLAEWQAATQTTDRRLPKLKTQNSKLFWATGQCLSYGQGLAYHLLIDLLHSLLGAPAIAAEAETRAALRGLCRSFLASRP